MQDLGSFEDARCSVLADAQKTLAGIRSAAAQATESVAATIAVLTGVRKQAQDCLHQIRHQQMIVSAAEWLVRHRAGDESLRWLWNPRSADRGAVDLVGLEGDAVAVCAEVNALEEPVSVSDTQMRRSLLKLAAMNGRRFYFVRSASMKRRAVTKVVKAGWDIAVVQIAAQWELPSTAHAVSLVSLAGAGLGAGSR
jgi:hypothetical protein